MGPGNGGTVAHGFNPPSGSYGTRCPEVRPVTCRYTNYVSWGIVGRSGGEWEPLSRCAVEQYMN